jgi:tRNA(fMet)-specific endonuclease VapC
MVWAEGKFIGQKICSPQRTQALFKLTEQRLPLLWIIVRYSMTQCWAKCSNTIAKSHYLICGKHTEIKRRNLLHHSIDFMRGLFPTVADKLQSMVPEEILVSAIVKAELLLGAEKSSNPSKSIDIVRKFLAPFKIIPFDSNAAEQYAKIRADLEKRGLRIGPNDLLIAATVLSNKSKLVTRNVKEFSRINGLEIESWSEITL